VETRRFTHEDLAEATAVLRAGGVVAVPTETVYGLCCSGLDARAVERIYGLKGRPAVKPLSLMIHDFAAAERYCIFVPTGAQALADRFLPGPLTIVLPARETVPDIVRAGGDTVGLRCPDHPLTLELLRELDAPLAGPSANPSGAPSPRSAQAVLDYFDGQIEGVLDGGECAVGVESSIIDMSKTPYRILRVGALSEETVFAALESAMTVIGVTGGTGSGKTTALEAVREQGGLVIDCDAVYHELLRTDRELLGVLDARFPGVIRGGVLDRKALGGIVFADPAALLDLNALTHGAVRREVDRRLQDWAKMGGELAAVDAIALFESGLGERCTHTLAVTAPRERRVERLMRREGISRDYAEKRIDAQKSDTYFAERCDKILINDGTLESLREKCRAQITEWTGR